MSIYNLVRNAYFDSLTTSGTGNVDLSWSQLESLMDGVTTSGGVTLTASGILFLETDLSQRIKVDEIRLYANDLGQSANINFYYRDTVTGSYTLLTTQSGSYYYATIPSPSAPRYIRATISGIAITLYEFEVLNDDYVVAFGEDGTQYAEYLGDTPIGEEGTPQAVAIYNNGTSAIAADAYVCIDYTGNEADNYLRISSSETGTYYGIEDGALIEDDQLDSEYRWSMGVLSGNVTISSDKIITTNTSTTYTYPTTIPLSNVSNSFNCAEHCWDYDSVNDKLYVMGSDGILKLWIHNYRTVSFTYLTEISPGCINHSNRASMAYLDGKIYVLTDGDQTFGSYTLSGVVDNWTTLSGHPVARSGTYPRRNICSDYNRYIYCIDNFGNSGTKNFYRYDTISGTWSALSNGYYLYTDTETNLGTYSFMSYDTNRDYIYVVIGHRDYSDQHYIQRYSVATNTWNTSYLYFGDLYNWDNPTGRSMYYCNDSIFFMTSWQSTSYRKRLYRYNLLTATWTYDTVDFIFTNPNMASAMYVHFIVIYADGQYMALASKLVTDAGAAAYSRLDAYPRSVYTGYNAVSGTFTSPIFELDEPNNASYFLTEGTAVSGLGSISYDSSSYNGTIRVRSSNDEPLIINEVYTINNISSSAHLNVWNIYPNIIEMNKYNYYINRQIQTSVANIAVDRRTGIKCVSYRTSNGEGFFSLHPRTGSTYLYYNYVGGWRMFYNVGLEFDYAGGCWGYGNYDSTAYRLDHFYYNASVFASVYDGSDFLYALAVEWDGDGVWYTDKNLNLLVHKNTNGTTLQSIILPQPRAVCSTTDNGCWVIDNTNLSAYRYTSSGVLSKAVDLGRTATRMTYDYNNGFWYFSGITIYHVTSEGIEDLAVNYSGVYGIKSTRDGCCAFNNVTNAIKYIDYAAKAITKTWNSIDNISNYDFGVFSIDVSSQTEYKLPNTNFIPASYDPVWDTTSGSLTWQEVRKDGYFLPKHKYHQVEVTLRGVASLEKILMPPAIKVQDIASKTYKNAYIKTVIPAGTEITDYETRLRTWWGVDE